MVGDLSEAGSRAEMEMKVLLWAVQRLIGGLSTIGAERDIASRLHVVLPGSPNRGMFGGDGAYGEAKSALDAVVSRWHAESSWAARVSLAHALIGWTRGTGLMGHNDAIVAAVEEAGVTTYSTDEMAALLLDLCDAESKVAAARSPIKADLTGGLAEANLDMAELAAKAREQMSAAAAVDEDAEAPGAIAALPSPPRGFTPAPPPQWDDLDVDPADLVVIVGGAEIGPYGSSRTRFEMEVENELSAAGVLELAWTTGLIRWEDDPQPGWYDTESGEMVDESELVQRYHDAVVQRVGIREFVDDARSTPTTPRRCWCRCSWRRTSRSWCPRRPMRAPSSSSIPSTRSSGRCPTPPTGRSSARPAPRSGCRERPSCPASSAARSRPGSTRRCGASAQTWPVPSTGWRYGTWWRPSTRSCRPVSARPR